MRDRVILLSVSLASLFLWLATPAAKALETGNNHATLTVAGVIRTYFVHVPKSYNGTQNVPLVLVLHGRGGDGEIISKYTRMTEKSDEVGFIAVYPDALGSPRAWNSGYNTGRNNGDDVAFLKMLIATIKQSYRIDPARVYVTGHSSGAMMSYRLGAELSDQIAAIAPVAGSVGATISSGQTITIPTPLHPVSVLAIHGQQDNTVPYNGGGRGGQQFLSVVQSITFWVNANSCTPPAQVLSINTGKVTVRRYDQCKGNTSVTLYSVVEGDHTWPGMRPRRDKTGNQDLSSTDIIWEFFANHPKSAANP